MVKKVEKNSEITVKNPTSLKATMKNFGVKNEL